MVRLLAVLGSVLFWLFSAAAVVRADTQTFTFTPSGTSSYYLTYSQNLMPLPNPVLTAVFTDVGSGTVQVALTTGSFQPYMSNPLGLGFFGFNVDNSSGTSVGSSLTISSVAGRR